MLQKREHIHYFDYLRIIAAISVIYMHVAALPLRGAVNIQWQMLNVCTSFAFTAVPLFFMMSGYLLISDPKTGDISVLLKRRIPRLIIPLIGWTIVALLWLTFSGGTLSVSSMANGLISALNTPVMVHFWYMYTIIALYLISPFLYGAIHSLEKKGHIYILVLIALVSVRTILRTVLPQPFADLLNIDFITKLEFFDGHLCTFILGFYLGSCKRKIPNWILAAGAVLTLAVITAGTYFRTAAAGTYMQDFQNQNAGIYMMHNILLSMFYAVGISPQTKLEVTLVTLLNLVICTLVLKTVATIKPICYLATGMSYKTACSSCNWVYTYRWIKRRFQKKKIDTPQEI